MSSTALKSIATESLDWWTRLRLESVVRKARSKKEEYVFEQLLDKVGIVSPEVLAMFLSHLVEKGIVRRVIRVVSPSAGGGLGDYESLEDIPSEEVDALAVPPERFTVTPGHLRVVYKFDG